MATNEDITMAVDISAAPLRPKAEPSALPTTMNSLQQPEPTGEVELEPSTTANTGPWSNAPSHGSWPKANAVFATEECRPIASACRRELR
jgi:hypothetical protein